jgi:SAM-dependent methyltransferase
VSSPDRWTVQQLAQLSPDGGAGTESRLLRRAADYLESLGAVCVQELLLQTETTPEGRLHTLTVLFDRSKMKVDLDLLDPRLVGGDGLLGHDGEFMIALAAEVDAGTVVDLGCGKGRLARELADGGRRRVIGIDPAAVQVEFARRQPGAKRVEWVIGDASALGTPEADLVVMTGNVAQILVEDVAWMETLRAIHAGLRPSGYLAFGSRNPEDRAWERWNVTHPDWVSEVISVKDHRVVVVGHIDFSDVGETLHASSEYRFRSLNELTSSLVDAGFTVEHTYGDWQRGPLSSSSEDIVLVARRR